MIVIDGLPTVYLLKMGGSFHGELLVITRFRMIRQDYYCYCQPGHLERGGSGGAMSPAVSVEKKTGNGELRRIYVYIIVYTYTVTDRIMEKKKRFNLQAPPVYDRKVTNLFFP